MKSISVSVIVPVHNGELYIGRCIRSLLNQTLNRDSYEIIVVNDASDDKTKQALSSFRGEIRYFENNKKLGLPGTLNVAIKQSKGQFIVRVDSDDYVHSEYLNILSLHLSLNNNLDAVACDYILVNNNQDAIREVNWNSKPIGCGVMFKTQHIIKIGMYDKNFLAKEDEDLLIRFRKNFNVTRLPIPLYKYRQHNNNMTKNKNLLKKYSKKLKKKHI
tara:strand:- start:9368 stop:10018 length:651 start_codon:yes stop_codon:yes gene_type:complete